MENEMSEQNEESLNQKHAKTSPQIEDEILGLLDGDLKERAMGFAAYLRANHLTPRQWFGPGYWRIPHGNEYLCAIVINKDRWRFWFFQGDYSGEFDEGFIQAVHGHVKPCISCGGDCPKGKDTTVFGKEFANTCFQFPVQFENPDGSTVESIQELIEYWKEASPRSDSWHVR